MTVIIGDHVDDGEIVGMKEFSDLGALWLAQSLEDGAGVRHRASHHFADCLVRCVLSLGITAVCDELVHLKKRHLGLLPNIKAKDRLRKDTAFSECAGRVLCHEHRRFTRRWRNSTLTRMLRCTADGRNGSR